MEGDFLYHYVAGDIKSSNSYLSVNLIDDAPSFLSEQKIYYSYDGHYFYDDFEIMIDDYKAKSSVNADNEYSAN